MNPVENSARILNAAAVWLGTPYRHQASMKGVGCDCLGLIRGVWRDLYGEEPEEPGPYAPDWAERGGAERLADAALRHFGPPIDRAGMQPGDVLLFRFRPGVAAKHLGILDLGGRFIHAYEQVGVISSPMVPSWARRIVAVHRFPAM